jgi:O-antigen/teichoic acid export membrane protein
MMMVSAAQHASKPRGALSLRLNMSWTFLANGVYGAGQWLLLILIAKLGNAAMLGMYALGVAVVTPVLMLCSLNLRPVVVTDVENRFSFQEYLGVRVVTTIVGAVVVAVIVAISHSGWYVATVTAVVFVGMGAEAISDVTYGPLQRREQMDKMSISMCYRSALAVIALGVALFATKSILWGTTAIAAARLFVCVTYDLRQSPADSWDKTQLLKLGRTTWQIIWNALPLGIVLMLYSLNSNIPRYFIGSQSGVRELGIFSASASIVTIGGTVVNSLGQAAMPQLAKQFNQGQFRSFALLLGKLLAAVAALGVGGTVLAMMFGREFLRYAFRPEYAEQSRLLVTMMAAGAISYMTMILGYSHTAAQYFRPQVPLLVAATLAVLIAAHFLIPAYSLLGAVASLGISWIVLLVGELIVLGFVFVELRDRSVSMRSMDGRA